MSHGQFGTSAEVSHGHFRIDVLVPKCPYPQGYSLFVSSVRVCWHGIPTMNVFQVYQTLMYQSSWYHSTMNQLTQHSIHIGIGLWPVFNVTLHEIIRLIWRIIPGTCWRPLRPLWSLVVLVLLVLRCAYLHFALWCTTTVYEQWTHKFIESAKYIFKQTWKAS